MGNFDYFNRVNQTQFFNHFNPLYDNERKLYDLLMTEAINQHGVSLTYFVLSYNVSTDRILGEDNNRQVERCFDFMGNLELPKDIRNYSINGVGWNDIFHIFVSKVHLSTASTCDAYGNLSAFDTYTPRAGDLLRLSYNDFKDNSRMTNMFCESPNPTDKLRSQSFNNTYYEIISVKGEEEQFLQYKHSWDLIVRVYRDKSIPISGSTNDGSNTQGIFGDLWKYTSKSDIFDIGKFINKTEQPNTNKKDIEYKQSYDECNPKDPFNDWWSDK